MTTEERHKIFREIKAEKEVKPEIPLTQLCKIRGVNYQTYFLWNKLQETKPDGETPHKMRVGVMVSVMEVASLVLNRVETIPVKVSDILNSMTDAERGKLYAELGRRQFEEVAKKR